MIPSSAIVLLCPTCRAPRLAADPSCNNCLQTRPELGWDFDPDEGLRELVAGAMTDRFALDRVEDHCRGHVRYRAHDVHGAPLWVHVVGHPMDADWTRGHAHLLRSAMEIEDPRLARILERGVIGKGAFFLVLEARIGPTLADVVVDGPLWPRRAQGLLLEILAAIEVLHDHDIVLRTLQPTDVVVVDDDGQTSVFLPCVDPAMAGAARTPDAHYLAPELSAGDPVDGKADVYSVGQMLRTALRVGDDDPRWSPPLRELVDALRQMTASEPDERPTPRSVIERLVTNEIPEGPWLSVDEPEAVPEYFLPPPSPMSDEARACAESLVDLLDSSVPIADPPPAAKSSLAPTQPEPAPERVEPPPRRKTPYASLAIAAAAVLFFALLGLRAAIPHEPDSPSEPLEEAQLVAVFPEPPSAPDAEEIPPEQEVEEEAEPEAEVPDWVHELDGTWQGVAADKPMTLDIDFAPNGRVTATLSTKRLLSRPVTLHGTWSEQGDGATVDLVGDGPKPTRYVGTFTDSNGVGQVLARNDRKRGVWSVRR